MKNRDRLPNFIAALWGFAEATLFFIIPDVFISYRALNGLRAALKTCLYALAGALIGGTLMYVFAMHSSAAVSVVRHVPGISSMMVTTANKDYTGHGAAAVIIAPLRTAPYKLYAALAPAHHVGLLAFLAVSVMARLARFVLIALVVSALSKWLGQWLSRKTRTIILVLFWLIFYSIYFYYI